MQKFTLTIASVAAMLLSSAPAQADFVGVYASADYWNYDGAASVAQTNKTPENFDLGSEKQASIAVSIEHPVPFLPNVRVRHTSLKGADTLNSLAFAFDNQLYVGDVNLALDFTSTDLILYYEILDNVVSVDVGVAAKQFDGELLVQGNTPLPTTSTVKFTETIPLAYASVGGSLPFTGFSFKAEAAGVSYDGSSVSDIQAEVKYDFIDNLAVDVGLKAGYRQLKVDLEDVEKTDANLDFKGPYLGLEVHF